jgi:hypothetical protein
MPENDMDLFIMKDAPPWLPLPTNTKKKTYKNYFFLVLRLRFILPRCKLNLKTNKIANLLIFVYKK